MNKKQSIVADMQKIQAQLIELGTKAGNVNPLTGGIKIAKQIGILQMQFNNLQLEFNSLEGGEV